MLSKTIALFLSMGLGATASSDAVVPPTIRGNAAIWATALRRAESEGHRRVQLRMSDGRKVNGNIVRLYSDTCVIQDGRRTIEVPYGEIDSAKWKNHALSRPVKYALIFAIGFGALLAAALATR
jgi:hypothetical protein